MRYLSCVVVALGCACKSTDESKGGSAPARSSVGIEPQGGKGKLALVLDAPSGWKKTDPSTFQIKGVGETAACNVLTYKPGLSFTAQTLDVAVEEILKESPKATFAVKKQTADGFHVEWDVGERATTSRFQAIVLRTFGDEKVSCLAVAGDAKSVAEASAAFASLGPKR